MKKFVIFALLVMTTLLSACTFGRVGENRIKEDLQKEFTGNDFVVNNVTIDLAEHKEDISTYNITATMSAPNADIKRMYTVIYKYYDVGGWLMDSCTETRQNEWEAAPHSYELSDEQICDEIFEVSDTGGYYVAVDDAQFKNWTSGSSSDLPKTNNLKNYRCVEKENSTMKILVECKAHSKTIEIFENFETVWEFNKQELEWKCISRKSVGNDYNFFTDFSGRYHRDDNELNVKKAEKGFVISGCIKYSLYVGNDSEYVFNDVPINVSGLFSMGARIKDEGYVNDPEKNDYRSVDIYFSEEPVTLYFNRVKYEKCS